MVLKACAYWTRLDGVSVPTATQKTVTVTANRRLDDAGLHELMDEVEESYTNTGEVAAS